MRSLNVLVRGAGEHASATAHRLFRCGLRVVMTEVQHPTAVRRAVSFCTAVFDGTCAVEDVPGRLWNLVEWEELGRRDLDHVPVFVDPEGRLVEGWRPDVIVDARILKRNDGNSLEQAPLVIGLGPGLLAGQDVHLVIETLRGHDLGRIIRSGYGAADTGVPGPIAGHTAERVLRAPCAGTLETRLEIGQLVHAGDVVCTVAGQPVQATISGMLRGVVHGGIEVPANLKVGDVDPRGEPAFCFTISDKARTIAGSVLEAILSRFPPRWP
ncbi:MAG TPA: selenium-dependent molybdenum cofactor biosynthesis protein YqeB [Thermoanaerobaculaceae bacterium]|nr:selenium-dependent molybdenum cofactor biosynthesis protein YqeB [Thermoanaerobaculaceae bacterium]HPS77859.1 selenium-dependent molybdenum cofactor biosynthesis protein YqeB [Thermoanaerobaculaceae bacterium]